MGWIEGRVSALLPEGGARISTLLGLVVAPEAGTGMLPGDRVRLRLNPQTGKVEAEALRPGAALGNAAASAGAGARAPGPVAALLESGSAHLNSAALASLAPILPGPASGLGAALPPPGAALYGLIAALFPSESFRERSAAPARRHAPAGKGETLAKDEAETGEDAPLGPSDPVAPVGRDPLDVIDWRAPETGEEPEEETAEAEPEREAPALPARVGQVARMSGRLPDGGEVHLDARRVGDLITLDVLSDAPLPAEFARLIRRQAEALALAWGARLSCNFRRGPAAAPA